MFLILGGILAIVIGEVHLSPFHLTKSHWVDILSEIVWDTVATKVKSQVSSVALACMNKIDYLPFNFELRTRCRLHFS